MTQKKKVKVKKSKVSSFLSNFNQIILDQTSICEEQIKKYPNYAGVFTNSQGKVVILTIKKDIDKETKKKRIVQSKIQ